MPKEEPLIRGKVQLRRFDESRKIAIDDFLITKVAVPRRPHRTAIDAAKIASQDVEPTFTQQEGEV
jgi:hypothetical protein